MKLKLKESGSELNVSADYDQMDMLEIVDKIWFMLEKQERINVDFMNMPSSVKNKVSLESSSSSIPMLHEKYEKEM